MINDLKELAHLLKLCRKQGVTEVSWDGLALKFGPLPEKRSDEDSDTEAPEETYVPGVGVIPAGMTPEQFVFMSSPSPQPAE